MEIQFSDFTNQAMDQIVNQAAKIHYMLGGAMSVPMVLRAPLGSGTGAAAQHSQSLEAWFAHVPGLKVVMPATAADAKGLLLSAIDDPNPVIVLEHKLLYRTSGPVPEEAVRVPLGKSAVRRRGEHITIVATGVMVSRSLEAAEILAADGIEVSVIDPRTLTPLDDAPIHEDVSRTGRALLVQEAPGHVGFTAELVGTDRGVPDDLPPARARPPPQRPRRADPLRPAAGEGIGPAGRQHRRGGHDDDEGVLMARLAIRMPKMSMTMTEGEVSEWMVRVGDEVAEGDVVCEVMTDKVDMEVESTVTGTLVEIVVESGMVEVGEPIGWVEGEDTGGGFGDLLVGAHP